MNAPRTTATGGIADTESVLSMGGDSNADLDRLGMDENSIRGFWRRYRQFMQV